MARAGNSSVSVATRLARAAGLKAGVVSTGNSLDFVSEDLKQMHAAEAAVKDMEAAAVAYVCRLCGTPMLALKAVTDIVDGDKATPDEFLENLSASSAALQGAVARVIAYMDGRALDEL